MKKYLDMELFCIYNDMRILNKFLLESIERQNVQCKVTLYDGSINHKRGGAASIYNKLISDSDAKVLVCIHQDVSFMSDNVLQDIYDFVSSHSQYIIGAAGVRQKQGGNLAVYGNVVEGNEGEYNRLIHIKVPKEVLCVDECFFAFHKKVYQLIQFDEKTCDGWHFYAADLCYSAKKFGIQSVVYPVDIWHKSTGRISDDFYVQLRRIQKKYRKNFNRFITPCINCNTKIPALYYKVKRIIWLRRERRNI